MDRADTPPHLFFSIERFVQDFIGFFALSAVFYEKSQYHGSHLLDVNLRMPEPAQVWQQAYFLSPSLEMIRVDNAVAQMRVTLHPLLTDRWQGYLEATV